MTSAIQLFTSSIGRKLVMSLTGLFLCSFLIVHCSANACLFIDDEGLTFNAVADFMENNIIIRIIEYGLFAAIIIHILQSVALTVQNRNARGNAYVKDGANKNSKWYSRNMGVLGSIIFFFLVVHLINFFIGLRFDDPYSYGVDANGNANLYANVKEVFSVTGYGIFYVVCMIALGFHLQHGFSSAFRTLGVGHHYYIPLIKNAGYLFSIVIPAIFAAMPLYFLLFRS